MSHPQTHEQLQARINVKHEGRVRLLESSYKNTRDHATFIDIEHGEWRARLDSVLAGREHPRRIDHSRKTRRVSREAMLENLKRVHGDTVTLGDDFVMMTRACTFIDIDHGSWVTSPAVVLHGCRHPAHARQNHYRISRDEIESRLRRVHGKIVKLGDDYVDTKTKCTFIDDKHGPWRANPNHVCMGMSHPLRQAQKSAQTRKSFPIVTHWKTGDECHSQSGWEFATLLWLNKNRYDFDWQVPFVTELSTKKARKAWYIVDLYLKSGPFTNTYVEIKGAWNVHNNERNRLKWEWFHTTHANSVLWMSADLHRLGVLHRSKPHPALLEWWKASQCQATTLTLKEVVENP